MFPAPHAHFLHKGLLLGSYFRPSACAFQCS